MPCRCYFCEARLCKASQEEDQTVEDFDPRPDSFRGTVSQSLPELLQKLKGEQLCVSLLFDSQFQSDDVISDELSSPSSHSIPGMATLKDTISQFKETQYYIGEVP